MASRPGDWNCPHCGVQNFASRTSCFSCSKAKSLVAPSPKPGDWNCASCGEHNFSSRTSCRKCNTSKGTTTSYGTGVAQVDGFGHGQLQIDVRKGDWICGKCSDLNFANKTQCRKCGSSKSTAAGFGGTSSDDNLTMKAGDWACLSCGKHNFSSRTSCYQCTKPRV